MFLNFFFFFFFENEFSDNFTVCVLYLSISVIAAIVAMFESISSTSCYSFVLASVHWPKPKIKGPLWV